MQAQPTTSRYTQPESEEGTVYGMCCLSQSPLTALYDQYHGVCKHKLGFVTDGTCTIGNWQSLPQLLLCMFHCCMNMVVKPQ